MTSSQPQKQLSGCKCPEYCACDLESSCKWHKRNCKTESPKTDQTKKVSECECRHTKGIYICDITCEICEKCQALGSLKPSCERPQNGQLISECPNCKGTKKDQCGFACWTCCKDTSITPEPLKPAQLTEDEDLLENWDKEFDDIWFHFARQNAPLTQHRWSMKNHVRSLLLKKDRHAQEMVKAEKIRCAEIAKKLACKCRLTSSCCKISELIINEILNPPKA